MRLSLMFLAVLVVVGPTVAHGQRRKTKAREKTPAEMSEEELYNFRVQMLKENKLHFAGVAVLMGQCTDQAEKYQKRAAELEDDSKAKVQAKYYTDMAAWYSTQAAILKKLQPWKREEFYLQRNKDKSQAARLRKIIDYNKKLQIAFVREHNKRPYKPKRRRR